MSKQKPTRRVQKADLPTKICAACGRPFSWRKKWARDWDRVLYCSDRCRVLGRREVTPGVADRGP